MSFLRETWQTGSTRSRNNKTVLTKTTERQRITLNGIFHEDRCRFLLSFCFKNVLNWQKETSPWRCREFWMYILIETQTWFIRDVAVGTVTWSLKRRFETSPRAILLLTWRVLSESVLLRAHPDLVAAPMICILLVAGHGTVLETQVKVNRKERTGSPNFVLLPDVFSNGLTCSGQRVTWGYKQNRKGGLRSSADT